MASYTPSVKEILRSNGCCFDRPGKGALSENVKCTPILWDLMEEGGIAENPKGS